MNEAFLCEVILKDHERIKERNSSLEIRIIAHYGTLPLFLNQIFSITTI